MTNNTDNSRRAMLIINPISGTGSKEGVEELARKRLGEVGIEVETRFTGARGDATRIASEATTRGFRSVLACGGDGTINETARALCGTPTTLGILPAGSGNGLARHVGVPVDIAKALDIIADGNVMQADYGTTNGNPFFCTFGLGFDAAVSHRFARQSRRGVLSYIKSTLEEYLRFRPQTYTISANGKLLTEKAFLIAVCNASQWGNNAYIAPDASITDGLLDIVVVHSGTPIDAAVMGMDIFTGFISKNTMVRAFRAPAAVIYRNAPGEAHIDGEPVSMGDILDVKCHRRALRIFAPQDRGHFRPLITPVSEMVRDLRLHFNHRFRG